MKWTNKQKNNIRAYFRFYYSFRFMKTGEVFAKKSKNSSFGLLYTKNDSIKHLKELSIDVSNFH